MKKKTKLTLLLLSITVMMLAFGGSAHAAGKKAKALKAYDKFLSEKEKTPGSLFDTWGLAYLNNDSVPELLTYNSGFPATGKPCIYTYKKNKVVLVSLNASSCYYSHYYKKKGVVVSIYVPVAGHKDTSGFKGYYRVKNSDAIDGAIFDHSASAYKNWTTVDMNSFVSRIQYNTLAEELKAAGIDTKYDMLFQMNTPTTQVSRFQAIATVSGKTIKLNDNKVSENELGKMSYPGYGSPQYTKTRDTVFVYVLSN